MIKTNIKLKDGEHIVTAFATRACGPGWANTPIWIIIRGADGKLRQECLQPQQQTFEMQWLFPYSSRAHEDMVRAVGQLVGRKKKP